MAKITGIGGVFSNPPTVTRSSRSGTARTWEFSWSRGAARSLKWTDDKAEDHGLTVWHVAAKDTEWFSPSASSFMINYRIDNMAEILADLTRNGVETLKGPESDANGKFAWIVDPDGNKVELWEPMPWDENNKAK